VQTTSPTSEAVAAAASIDGDVRGALDHVRDYLLSIQHEDGHWCAEIEGDTIVESEYFMALYFLGRGLDERAVKLAEYIRRQQLADGAWAIYPGGPSEVSASVKAYFVLKLVGDDPSAEHMRRAREVILSLGGIEACNSFTKIYLSIFGQYRWDECPAVPPELILLPDWFPFTLYKISYWSRAIVVPLAMMWAFKPRCDVPEGARIDELRGTRAPGDVAGQSFRRRLWARFFRLTDAVLKGVERLSLTPFRKRALAESEKWILERLEHSDGLGAILPPILNTVIAFRCLGYDDDHLVFASQMRELEKLEIHEDGAIRIQPCFSPVWDTVLAAQALLESGVPSNQPALQKAVSWLLQKEARKPGDYRRRCPEAEPSGWYFEYRNEFYPDIDDTAAVLNVLSRSRLDPAERDLARRQALARGLQWELAMQSRDGGWGAFDKDCSNEVFTFIPFADHNAMIDPSCEDVTGRALEAFRHVGLAPQHPAVRRGVEFLRAKQDPDGTWYGRWGCNYIYGSWLALRGLQMSGEDLSLPRYRRTIEWLRKRQNPDGGWGELPRSYDDPAQKGIGPSTASQTAWALMTFFAAGQIDTPATRAGLAYLLRTQDADGSWTDDYWTGTGFPKVFYLRYHLYATYFPLMALSLYLEARPATRSALHLVSPVHR
jgi:squalene-hopene/tetraprenyl-beta-curcumene cyclase